jgi:urease accessory protein
MKRAFPFSAGFKGVLSLMAMLFLPTLAEAHPGLPGYTHGFINGLTHPLTGLDHICAMVAVGLWAAQRGGRVLWAVPLTFISVMAVGGMAGSSDITLPFVKTMIAASVLVLGILIGSGVRLPLSGSVLLIGLFAFFHGFAHGIKMPDSASGLAYGMGFLLATAGLHLGGIGLGLAARKWDLMQLIRLTGGAIVVCGIYFCITAG